MDPKPNTPFEAAGEPVEDDGEDAAED